MRVPAKLLALVPLAAALALAPRAALAHKERPILSPVRPGPTPDPARKQKTFVVVCKASSKPTKAELADIQQRIATSSGDALVEAKADLTRWRRNTKLFRKCRYEHIQEAVNAVGDGTDIKVLPGIYREEPSRAVPSSPSGDLPDGSFSYEYHLANPNDANLVGIIGKKNITLDGMGGKPTDVLVDAGFVKDVVIRADRADGFIVRNLWGRDANEHGIYVVDTDGYVFDHCVGSYSWEYELFSFASDNGLYQDCEAVGGGDSGFYIGGAPETPGRFSSIITRAKMHHNALGFSGTQGNSVQITDSDIYDNSIGISFDSELDHPNFRERSAVIENNLIHDNNYDIYAADSDVPPAGPAYDFFRYPVGTGLWIVGGDNNIVRNNYIYNNQRLGMILAANPNEGAPFALVNGNQMYGNIVGKDPAGNLLPNSTLFPPGGVYAPGGSDFYWDETGFGNCWGPQDPASGPVKYDPPNADSPAPIPGPCPTGSTGPAGPFPPFPQAVQKLNLLISCQMTQVPGSDPPVYVTADTVFPCPFGHTNDAPYENRDGFECGNGVIDLLDPANLSGGGEDCDVGGYGGGVFGETCDSIGHGPGTLLCNAFCTYDTSGCLAPTCDEFGASRLRIRRLNLAPGEQYADFTGEDLPGGGHTFDPFTEDVNLVVRDQGGLVYAAVIPGGTSGWTSGAGAFTFTDPTGAIGGITSVELTTDTTFADAFSVRVRVRGSDVTAAADSQTATTTVRIGNDCWQETAPCTPTSSGNRTVCRGRALP